MTRRAARLSSLLVSAALLAAACGDEQAADTAPSPTGGAASQMQVIVASVDHYVEDPQRVLVGLVFGDGSLVSFGTVRYAFSYLGTSGDPATAEPGPTAEARYLPTPGTATGGATPAVTLPSEARGVYEATGVTFDRAGYWSVEVTADLADGTQVASATFGVNEQPQLPAPGQQALETQTLLFGDPDVPAAAVDSRAATGGEVPDPDLHAITIADALARGDVIAVLFATPVYCMSQFCGPNVGVFESLAAEYGGAVTFIHVEIWKDFANQVINKSAADWLYRNQDLTEPWLYVIGRDGIIVDRWGSLFDTAEVRAALDATIAA